MDFFTWGAGIPGHFLLNMLTHTSNDPLSTPMHNAFNYGRREIFDLIYEIAQKYDGINMDDVNNIQDGKGVTILQLRGKGT